MDMKLKNYYKKPIYFIWGLVCLCLLVACSNDDEKQSGEKAPLAIHNPFDHSHDEVVTDVVKHKFEHVFAEDCVTREVKMASDKDGARERFEKPCMCIAQFLMKDLTAQEAEKFMNEHKNAQSLRIKYDNAAYHCLQQQPLPKGPKLFGR